jgi:peptide deformylase
MPLEPIMALRKVLHFPHPHLRLIAKPVTEMTTEIQTLVGDMFETLYAEDGVGLAATQIDVQQRIIVMDVSDSRDQPMCFINPEILERNGKEERNEGCLSVPGVYDKVQRAENIRVKFLDRHGNAQELTTGDLLAVCIQHEIDHLNGKLFIDYLSPLKKQRIEKKLKKLHDIQF